MTRESTPAFSIALYTHTHTHTHTHTLQGPFYFGNVKSVVDWHASNSSGLFPHGLPAFADKLGLPLQLYTPFWADAYQSK